MVDQNYKYVAKNAQGKIVKGKIYAVNKYICIKYLESKNLQVEQLIEFKSLYSRLSQVGIGRVLKPKQLVFFLRQFGVLLNSGVMLLNAIEMLLLQEEKIIMRKLFLDIYQHVYSGYSLSQAFATKPNDFPKYLVNMIEVGEMSGKLSPIILEMADYYEKQFKLTNNIKSAIRMPIIYLIATILIAVGMILFVFPSISSLYASFGDTELPGITLFFLNASEFVAKNIFAFVGIIVGITVLLILLIKYSFKVRYQLTKASLQIPIIGGLLQMNNQIIITNTLSQMLSNGINSMKSLKTLKTVLSNDVYQEVVDQTMKYIEEGLPFSRAFQESPFIDTILAKMIASGEKAGDLPGLMKNMAEYYNSISDMKVSKLKDSIQPILLLVVYAIVGVMILALMLPMLALGTQI
ncbi:MAG: type II secretion system F family protein [Clostridia bacterium]